MLTKKTLEADKEKMTIARILTQEQSDVSNLVRDFARNPNGSGVPLTLRMKRRSGMTYAILSSLISLIKNGHPRDRVIFFSNNRASSGYPEMFESEADRDIVRHILWSLDEMGNVTSTLGDVQDLSRFVFVMDRLDPGTQEEKDLVDQFPSFVSSRMGSLIVAE